MPNGGGEGALLLAAAPVHATTIEVRVPAVLGKISQVSVQWLWSGEASP